MSIDSCCICYENIINNQIKPSEIIGCECTIKLHLQCMEDWFNSNKQRTCPICMRINNVYIMNTLSEKLADKIIPYYKVII